MQQSQASNGTQAKLNNSQTNTLFKFSLTWFVIKVYKLIICCASNGYAVYFYHSN